MCGPQSAASKTTPTPPPISRCWRGWRPSAGAPACTSARRTSAACTTSSSRSSTTPSTRRWPGFCSRIEITIEADSWVTVRDNGRGIPVDKHKTTGKSALETIMTVLHAGGKFGGGAYKVSGGLHGVGASVVNALSAQDVGGGAPRAARSTGRSTSAASRRASLKTTRRRRSRRRPARTTGFLADDDDLRRASTHDYDALLQRFREMAYLTKGIWIRFDDKRAGREREMNFCFEGGVASFVRHINKGRNTLSAAPDLRREDGRHDAGRGGDSSTTTASRRSSSASRTPSTRSTAART